MRWIVTDNIYTETWNRLLEFSNVEITINQIEKFHAPPSTNRVRDNFKKQATQARVCILQAKEYFDAAREASIFTSPNHCYYGAVALASLMMLILGDGRKSLDYLRSDSKNCHHGLDFKTGCNASAAATAINLLEQSYAKVMPFGQFANWYKILPEFGASNGRVKRIYPTFNRSGRESVGNYKVDEFKKLSGSNLNLVDLIKFLPDLSDDLGRFGINAICSRSSLDVEYDHRDNSAEYRWAFHGCTPKEGLMKLLEGFKTKPQWAENFTFAVSNEDDYSAGGIVKFRYKIGESSALSWPDTRETVNHDIISYAEAITRHEIVDLYVVAYQLSMLSRYFPDIWVSCMESQCRAAKIVERVTDVFMRKFPILALSLILGEEVIISTHRPPWQI
ncbi:YaaC family protein [Burkholderia cenocepacia]|uniref:YaaC family protein n=1 Tax=Burkholderia cenocepacia TaxID=95486 RepID=UPI001CF310EC|nr:YaaC family protein [Burkholderia cenocepacia]MCA7923712.1 YaaC family protein [Burkholderia cenocepacia]